ncbi:MAG: hypothetical protein SF002_16555 [Alphaproteobacteria bacterium]|nr:hypothetical protein [Alphaproteobacteria bacterium]
MTNLAARRPSGLDDLAARIDQARHATLAWLDRMALGEIARGVHRISAHHDPQAWPGVLLPGSYNAILCRDLIGGLDDWSDADKAATIAWLEQARLPDGRFRIAGMTDADVFKKPDPVETWRYIDFHVTNYTLGAIAALQPDRPAVLAFARPYLDTHHLLAWLGLRDLRDPWQEGNNIVNLASFLLLIEQQGNAAERALVQAAFDTLIAWHDRHREPTTGFWGVGQLSDATQLLHAFAGSMHNFHIWYQRDLPLPGQAAAVDYCLSLPPSIHSACIDVDAVDVLVHGHRMLDHRRAEIEHWCRQLLGALLDRQHADGGFSDVQHGIRRQDGWVHGYAEPQGLSNTFATWFRWIAIAMIADLLWPNRWPWRFRQMIGIGYRKAWRHDR